MTITVTTPPKVFAGDDTAILTGQPIRLQAMDVNHSGFDTYSWSPADGLSDPSIAGPVANRLTLQYVINIIPYLITQLFGF